MIYSIYSKKDTTIYEGDASTYQLDVDKMNSGIDEILEIKKTVSSSKTVNTYNSRILLYFDIDWTKIDSAKEFTSGSATHSAFLNLYTSKAETIPYSYTLEAYPISMSWDMGLGRATNKPIIKEGTSWTYRDGETPATSWITGSFVAGSTGSNGCTVNGGATWYTHSSSAQTFLYESTDLRMSVKDILFDWSSSAYPNEGFIIKRSGSQECNPNRYGIVQYYAENTHTVYPPRLEICWDDKAWVTGSLSALDMSDTGAVFFYLRNNRGKYKRGGKIRFYTLGREKYPVKTYSNTSTNLDIKYTPNNLVCYSIKDVKTDETIIPYDETYTNLSCNSIKGNYFEIYSDSLFEERDYKIQLRYKPTVISTDYSYYDIKDTFKVVR